MSQKSDDSIERFFRKAVVQQDKTFMERDWASMEKMLDEHAIEAAAISAAKTQRIVKATSIAVLVVLLFVAGVNYRSQQTSNEMQATLGLSPLVSKKIQATTAEVHLDRDCSSDAATNTNALFDRSKLTALQNQKHLPTKQSVSQHVKNEAKLEHLTSQSNIEKKPLESSFPIVVDGKENDLESSREHAGSPFASETKQETLVGDSVIAIIQELTASAPYENEQAEDKDQSHLGRLTITGLISPDFSTTSLNKYSRPSGVFGVLLGYRITKRFTVMTGATKGLKRYEGYGQEYSPPAGYWNARTNGVIPDEVQGQCGIIEVPLFLQYDVLQRSRSRVFLSLGVSSYFMRTEYYQYTFNEPNPGAANSWTAKEPTRYLLKIGHLSAGVDRMISRRFAVGIEPFLKIPFEGIGWTDINLYSAGAYLNLRYNLVRVEQD
jgi:hypothetical protein